MWMMMMVMMTTMPNDDDNDNDNDRCLQCVTVSECKKGFTSGSMEMIQLVYAIMSYGLEVFYSCCSGSCHFLCFDGWNYKTSPPFLILTTSS